MSFVVDNYNIHGLVTISVVRRATYDIIPEVSHPLRYFRVAALDCEPDIIVEIGDFCPNNQNCYLIDHKYFVQENYLFCEDNYRRAKWSIEIDGIEHDQSKIRISGSNWGMKQLFSPSLFLESLVLKQVVAYHLSKNGYYLIHGASASKGDQAIILFGGGGSYKTTLLMNLLRKKKEWLVMGDDLVIIGSGKLLSFPTMMGIFAFRVEYLTTEELSLMKKIRLLFYILGRKLINIQVRDESKLNAVVHCLVGFDNEPRIESIDKEQAYSALINVAASEDYANWNIGNSGIFNRYVEAYSYIFPNNSLVTRWDNAVNELLSSAPEVKSLNLSLPFKPNVTQISRAIELLDLEMRESPPS